MNVNMGHGGAEGRCHRLTACIGLLARMHIHDLMDFILKGSLYLGLYNAWLNTVESTARPL